MVIWSAGAGQPIASLGAAPRFDEAALLEAGEDQFQKFLRDFLPGGDIGDLHRVAHRLHGEVEDRLQGILALYGNVHSNANYRDCTRCRARLLAMQRQLDRHQQPRSGVFRRHRAVMHRHCAMGDRQAQAYASG